MAGKSSYFSRVEAARFTNTSAERTDPNYMNIKVSDPC